MHKRLRHRGTSLARLALAALISSAQGLSLGVPYAAFSLVGDMKTLSKLIIIAVMIRGRHRALPLAIE